MKKSNTSNIVIEYADLSRVLPWLTQFAFVLALGLVTARAIMLETLRETFSDILSNTMAPRGCGAAGSVVLDLACCVPALLILLRRAFDKSYIVRFTWAQALLAIFAAWALLSTIWAGDKFEAIVLAFHLLAAAALFWAMAQLVRSWARLRLVAGLCMGVLLIYIAHGITYRFYDVPETVRYWEEHRAEEMQAHDWHEGDFSLQQYELKLKNGEMVGFDASPNSFAATVVLLGVIVAGAGVQRIVNRDQVGWIVATFLPLPMAVWMLWFARSKGALFTPILATGILVIIAKFGKMLNRKRKTAFVACGLGCVLAVIAVIGHGLFHGSLPTDSLNFRWRYWVASAHLFAAHPILGVGYGNFSYGYLAYRLPAAAEEIQDPHNLFVRAMTELGIIGLGLLIAWLARVWWEWTWPTMPASTLPKSAERQHGPRTMLITIASLSILGMLIRLLAGTDFSANENWVTLELITHLLYGLLVFIGYAVIVIFSLKDPSLDNRFSPWVLYGMLASLAVFLIHNTIDFAIFEIGPMMLFMLIGGAVLGVRSPSAVGMQKRNMAVKISFAIATIAWLIAVIFVATPLVQAENRAALGDEALRKHDFRLAAEFYQAAFMQAPVHNADYALRAARALTAVPNTDGLIRADLGNAIAASPQDALGYLTRARYNVQAHADEQADIHHDFETALALNPNDIDTRLEYARLLESWNQSAAAVEQYRDVLKINSGYDPTEPKRLPDAQVKDIQDRVERSSK